MNKEKAQTVVIINDHQLVTDLFCLIFRDKGYDIKGSFLDTNQGLAYVEKIVPSLVIIDMMMPFLQPPTGVRVSDSQPYILYDSQMSFEAVKIIRSQCPNTRILMVTGERHPHMFLKGFDSGADGIASKVDDLPSFINVLDHVMAGKKQVVSQRMNNLLQNYVDSQVPKLTPLEVHILELVQEGLESEEIGQRLNYAGKTIRNTLSVINQKLGTRNRFEAVEVAIEMGLVGWRTGYESRI